MHVGEIIHKMRKEKKITLSELADKSGVALATLSRVENGRMTGTLESYMKICEAFQITLPELYKDLPSSKKALEIQTKKAKPDVYVHDKKASIEILASNLQNKKMMPVLMVISKAGRTQSEKSASGIEKFVYVVDGKIEAYIGEDRYNLTKGDTLYFDSSLPHYFKNTGTGDARLIAVTSPPAAFN